MTIWFKGSDLARIVTYATPRPVAFTYNIIR